MGGQGQGGQLPHPHLHPVQQGLVQNEIALDPDKQGAAEGVGHADAFHVLPAGYVIKRFEHEEDRAALIGLDAGYVLGGNHVQRAVPVQGLVELTELAVPVDQQDIMGKPLLKIRRDGAVGRPLGIGIFHAVYHDLCHFLFYHMVASSYNKFQVNKFSISRFRDARDTIAVGQQGQVL